MRPEYQTAIETRLRWLKWSQGEGESVWNRLGFAGAMPFYRDILARGETYYMAPPFSHLVDHARRSVPDDVAFDIRWLMTERGFLYLDEAFECPSIEADSAIKGKIETLDREIDAVRDSLTSGARATALRERIARVERDFVWNRYQLDMLKGIEGQWRHALNEAATKIEQGAPLAEQQAALDAVKAVSRKWPGVEILVRAIGWRLVPTGEVVVDQHTGQSRRLDRPGVYVGCFQSFADYSPSTVDGSAWSTDDPIAKPGFGCWSYFTIADGESVGDRVERFEDRQATGRYAADTPAKRDRRLHPLHEIRWVYTAFHLMAQRLATRLQERPDRAGRRRIERDYPGTVDPLVTVVTLRRLAEKRERQGPERDVEWSCQWEVQGHWRRLPEKTIWIDSFTKGPPHLPFKRATRLFSAQR